MGFLRRAGRPRRGHLHRRPRADQSPFIAGPGRAFEIAQARLGPGRIHHCMRLIGLAEPALELACRRATAASPSAADRPLGGNPERIADARIAIDQARLLVLPPPGCSTPRALLRGAARRLTRSRPSRRTWPSGRRHGHPAPRRRRPLHRLPARRGLDHRPRPPPRRRPRRGPPAASSLASSSRCYGKGKWSG